MKKIIIFLKNGKIIGYWDTFEKIMCTQSLSLIDEKDVESEYEKAMFFIHLRPLDLIFPVIIPFNLNIEDVTNDLRQESKVIYDRLRKLHWPIKS